MTTINDPRRRRTAARDQPSLLDAIAATPEHWPQVRRVEQALSDRAATYKSDAEKLLARPEPDWPEAGDVYDEVARVLADIARDLRRDGTAGPSHT